MSTISHTGIIQGSPRTGHPRLLPWRDLGRRSEWLNAEFGIDLAGVVKGPVLGDHADGLDCLEILDRIAGNQKEIRQFALLDRPHALVLARVARRIEGG